MAEILDLSDPEFTAQMQGLVEQAQQALEERVTTARKEEVSDAAMKEAEERVLKAYQSLPQVLKPFVEGIAAVTRATGENSQILAKLEKAAGGSVEPLQQLPAVVSELQALLEKKEALSRQMFDALHE